MYVAKPKTLIGFAVTAELICVFVFAYANSRLSYDAAHMGLNPTCLKAQSSPQLVSVGALDYINPFILFCVFVCLRTTLHLHNTTSAYML